MNLRVFRGMLVAFASLILFLVFVGQVSAANDQVLESPYFTSQAVANEPVAMIATGALNVRSGPGLLYGSIAVLYQGQSVTVLGRHATNGWIMIRLYSGMEGWVNSNYTVTSVPVSSLPILAGPPATPPTPSPPIITYDAVVNTGAINLRSGPGTGYSIVTVAYQGQPLQLLGRNDAGSWVLVRNTSGAEGWANASLLRFNVSIWSLPIVTPAAPTPSATVVTGAVNVRTGPSPVYNSIAVVYSGQQLTLLGRNVSATWVQVRLANGTVGWVNTTYIQTNYPIHNLPIVGEIQPPANSAVVAVGALNVRYGPSATYGAFAVVYQGQTLGLVGRNSSSTWVQVRLPNAAIGWVNSNYIVGNVQIHTLPITG